jgi:hypothetical protein
MQLLLLFTTFCVAIFLSAVLCSAQPRSIELHGGTFLWLPTLSFSDVSGIPSPQSITFTGTSAALRPTFAVGTDVYDLDDLVLGVSLGYTPITMNYKAEERAPIALQGGGLYIATLRHDIRASLNVISVRPRIRYKPLSWLVIEGSIPLDVVVNPRYTQVMRFVDPEGLTFVDGQPEQVTGRGAIPNARRVIPSLAAHVMAELPMSASRSVMLQPRLGYRQALTQITQDGAYTLAGLEATLGIRIALDGGAPGTMSPDTMYRVPDVPPGTMPPGTMPPGTIYRAPDVIERDTLVELRTGIQQEVTELVSIVSDTLADIYRVRETYRRLIPKPPSVLRGSLALQFVDDDGTVTDKARLTATRVVSRRTVPLVPFVVFDSTSTSIPDRYNQLSATAAAQYQERSAISPDGHWHYHLLNIVGARMRSKRQSTCQLQMYAPSADTAVGNAQLRAVRAYLVSRFGVSESRIVIMPPSKGLTDDEGQQAGSTVVISDPTGRLVRPVEGEAQFVEARLPTVRITPDAISESGLRTWSVAITQSGTDKYSVPDSTGELRDVTIDLNDVMSADAAMKTPLSFILRLEDTEGARTQSEPSVLRLTSKALRPSERSTPLRRTEVLYLGGMSVMQQQVAPSAGQRTAAAPYWTTKGLQQQEMFLYEKDAKVFIQEERQP